MIASSPQIKRLLSLFVLILVTFSGCTTTQKQPVQNQKLADTHYKLGLDALSKEGMLPKAFEELMKSNALHPNQPEVLDALAYAWLLRGNYDKAEAHYKRALKHGAGSATQNNYANLLNKLSRFKEAEVVARKALNDPRYPNQDYAFLNLGDALLGQERLTEAIKAYHQAQLFSPGSRLPEIKMANAYNRADRLQEAQLLYQVLYSKAKNNRTIVEGYVSVLKKQGDTVQARHLLEDFSQSSSSVLDRAWAMTELKQLR